MKNLLFLPIDLDTSYLNNLVLNNTEDKPIWNPFWSVSNVELTVNILNFCEQLPLIKIDKFYYKTQFGIVGEHVDTNKSKCDPIMYENLSSNEPAGFHIIIKGSKNMLHVYDGESFIKTTIPKTTNSYVMNITETLHKVDEDENRQTIFIRGIIDSNRHKEFIKSNLEKYHNYAIYKKI